MQDPHKPMIIEDESELFHLDFIEDDNEEDEFTKWLLGDEWDDKINSTQEVRQ